MKDWQLRWVVVGTYALIATPVITALANSSCHPSGPPQHPVPCQDELLILPPGRYPMREICRSDQLLVMAINEPVRCVCTMDGGRTNFESWDMPGSRGYAKDDDL